MRQIAARNWNPKGRTNPHNTRVIDFYHACRRFRRGETKAIKFTGTIRQLRWALIAAAFSPDPDGPRAA